MLGSILPSAVAVGEQVGPRRCAAPLFPDEEQSVAGAVAERREEFAAGRSCAREALARLGVGPQPIPSGSDRAPVWPYGYVGSVTHCPGYVAAAVARRRDHVAIGIDAEIDAPLPEGVLELVSNEEERRRLPALPALGGVGSPAWDRVLFSAKEAVFKACYQLTGRRLGFEDAYLEIDVGAGAFRAGLAPGGDAGAMTALQGRWMVGRGLILTAIAVDRNAP
jgi:4'-phosphopantetheinyl transferase EntD